MTLSPHAVLKMLSAAHEVTRIPGNKYTGIIVAISVPPAMARQVATGTESAAELHVTLAFLGNSDKLTGTVDQWQKFVRALSTISANTGPFMAHFGGPGTFLGVGDDGKGFYQVKFLHRWLGEGDLLDQAARRAISVQV